MYTPKNSNHLRSQSRTIMALDYSRLGLENNNLLACFFFLLFCFFPYVKNGKRCIKRFFNVTIFSFFSNYWCERPGIINMLSNVADEQHQFHFSNTWTLSVSFQNVKWIYSLLVKYVLNKLSTVKATTLVFFLRSTSCIEIPPEGS